MVRGVGKGIFLREERRAVAVVANGNGGLGGIVLFWGASLGGIVDGSVLLFGLYVGKEVLPVIEGCLIHCCAGRRCVCVLLSFGIEMGERRRSRSTIHISRELGRSRGDGST